MGKRLEGPNEKLTRLHARIAKLQHEADRYREALEAIEADNEGHLYSAAPFLDQHQAVAHHALTAVAPAPQDEALTQSDAEIRARHHRDAAGQARLRDIREALTPAPQEGEATDG